MGKITDALKKAADDKIARIDRISRIKEHEKLVIRKMEGSSVDARLVAYFDLKSPITEQYKILMTNIHSLSKGKPPKVMMITSSIHSEGKTVTSLNLAISMAQAIKKPKILLIDADLRKGQVHRYLGVEKDVGLSDVLSGQVNIDDALFNIDMENLAFMSSGPVPHNPVELLNSTSMKNLISDLKAKFD